MGLGLALLGSAVIGGAASLLGGRSQEKGAKAAANAQAASSAEATAAQIKMNREAIAFQKYMFGQQRKDSAPWREIGESALRQIDAGMKNGTYDPGKFQFNFEADPGFKFRMQEGINALDASAAARGRLLSGAQDKAITRYGQNFASNEYGNAYARQVGEYNMEAGRKTNAFNRLSSVAGIGQMANQQDANLRANMTNNVSNTTMATGNAMAQGAQNTGNALAQGAINAGNARASAYGGMATAANMGIQNYLLNDYLKK